MHEMGIVQGILDASLEGAARAGAARINSIDVTIGELTEVVEDALQFAFEVLRADTMAAEAVLNVTLLTARSRCVRCGEEYDHGRFDAQCPQCGGVECELLQGRELLIDGIDVD